MPRYSVRAHEGGGEVGPRAGEIATAVAREAEKERGAAWAGAHAPSTIDAVAIIQRARGGDLHAVGVIFGWREQGFGRWLLKTYSDLRTWLEFAERRML